MMIPTPFTLRLLRTIAFIHRLGWMWLLLLLVTHFGPVWAQEPQPEPQLVTAIEMDQCGGLPWPVTIEVWNVGAAGGSEYARAIIRGQNCINDELVDSSAQIVGTFTGGPNGVASFNICDDPANPDTCLNLVFQFVEGRQLTYEGQVTGYVVQNPEAFEATAPPAPDCSATIHTAANLQPGDVLSPGASYAAVPGGEPVTPIGEAWFINGQNSASVVWDGRETTIELQYTCPGHQGHSLTITLPAAGEPTPTVTATPTATDTPAPTATESTGTPAPTGTPTPEPSATPTPPATRTPCPSLSADGKLAQILNRYYTDIPRGISSSGNKNNVQSLWDDKYDEFVCGSYQAKVLHLLDNLRFNPDP